MIELYLYYNSKWGLQTASSSSFDVIAQAVTCNTNCIFITNFEYGYSGKLDTGGGRSGVPGIPAASGELGADAICQYEAYESGSVIPAGKTFKTLILDSNWTPCGNLGCGESVDAGFESNWIVRPNTSFYTTDGNFFMTSDANGIFESSYNQNQILDSKGNPVSTTLEFWMGMSWLLIESNVDSSHISAWTSIGGSLNQTPPSNNFSGYTAVVVRVDLRLIVLIGQVYLQQMATLVITVSIQIHGMAA